MGCSFVPLGSHRVGAPWGGTLSTIKDAQAHVRCGLQRFPHEGFRWCWTGSQKPPCAFPTEWVSGSGGAIVSRSVTSCAGMTAYLVLLAQTRVGFLRGDEGKVSINSRDKNRLPKKKRLLQGRQWPSLVHSRSALLWAHWTCVAWYSRGSDYHGLFEIWCLLQWA